MIYIAAREVAAVLMLGLCVMAGLIDVDTNDENTGDKPPFSDRP